MAWLFDHEHYEDGPGATARRWSRPRFDTLILGCTHYPLVAPMLQRILGRDVRLVSGGHAVAAAVQRTMERAGIAREPDGEGDYRFLCTGDSRLLPRPGPALCLCLWARSSGWRLGSKCSFGVPS